MAGCCRTTFAGMAAEAQRLSRRLRLSDRRLVSLYEATFEPRWLDGSGPTGRRDDRPILGRRRTAASSTPASDHEALIARTKDPHDNATPSGNSMAALGLLRLAQLTGRADFRAKAEQTLLAFRGLMTSSPMAAGQMLVALDFFLGPVDEIAIVGDPASQRIRRCRSGGSFGISTAASIGGARQRDDDAVGLLKDRKSTAAVIAFRLPRRDVPGPRHRPRIRNGRITSKPFRIKLIAVGYSIILAEPVRRRSFTRKYDRLPILVKHPIIRRQLEQLRQRHAPRQHDRPRRQKIRRRSAIPAPLDDIVQPLDARPTVKLAPGRQSPPGSPVNATKRTPPIRR